MALHRLASFTMGVPNVAETAAYYREFGLTDEGDGWFSTEDGGRQLHIVPAPARRLVEVRIGVDDPDDLAAAAARLHRLDIPGVLDGGTLTAIDEATGVRAVLEVQPRRAQPVVAPTPYNGPGRYERSGGRAPGVLREGRVRPKKLGHVVLGTTDLAVTLGFFRDGLGFKVSDRIKDAAAFLRCSVDHHNVLVMNAPVTFLHHSSWQVDDIDEIGRGAAAMLEDHPERHVWGLGRHHAGSNFFWYLKDPSGTFSEYYSDMDCVPEDALWTPETFEGAKGLFNWGPPPPPSFLRPDDLAALMTGSHSG
ncbi:VOC family protein [Thermomonospora umbrina]|uniref:Glyoxalase/bleomycin resistance protein/dioxygenase superfamily protein n=1 Tax=Thermomonospora umbrina TaxID=111806 RepID=A0A3D9SRR2_9ACTN|nr:VOC family protein [Thermomonospora umbrina]REE95655.1 glyoxalase/bleomycin resistance protein/dioxygenase superfamily protein [Thermomonospora umbrina]